MRVIGVNTDRLEATITNEIAPPLTALVNAIKAGTPTDAQVRTLAEAVGTGVRKAIVQALNDSGTLP